MMADAVRRHASFNLIHLDSMFKVDVFVAKPRAFDRAQLERRRRVLLSEEPQCYAYVNSAEDVILYTETPNQSTPEERGCPR